MQIFALNIKKESVWDVLNGPILVKMEDANLLTLVVKPLTSSMADAKHVTQDFNSKTEDANNLKSVNCYAVNLMMKEYVSDVLLGVT